MPTRKPIRKTPCPSTEFCSKDKKTGNCNKPNPRHVRFQKLGYKTYKAYKNTLPDEDRHPKQYRRAICADLTLSKGAPKFKDATDHIKARKRLHDIGGVDDDGEYYDYDESDSDYKKRIRPIRKSKTMDKFGFIEDGDSDSDSDSEFSLDLSSDSDSDDDEYKKKDCTKMGNKCYSTELGTCVVPNSKNVWSKNRRHIGLTYPEFRSKLNGMEKQTKINTLCNLANRDEYGSFPCAISDTTPILVELSDLLPDLKNYEHGRTRCEKIGRYILTQIGLSDADAKHYTIDTPLESNITSTGVAIAVTYRGYSKRLLVVSTVEYKTPMSNVHKQGKITAAGSTAPVWVYITQRGKPVPIV